MKAKHVMTSPVKTGTADLTVRDVARTLSDHHISALPIVNDAGKLIGIVSEGDLIRRSEIGTQKRRSWWLSLLVNNVQLAEEYALAHANNVKDMMTRDVICVGPETELSEIAYLFERHRIKRVPVVDGEKLVGIVTRGNLVQAIATAPLKDHRPLADDEIRKKVQSRLEGEPWANALMINMTVHEGVVSLWGVVRSEAERDAVRIAVEGIAGVKSVKDNLALEPLPTWL